MFITKFGNMLVHTRLGWLLHCALKRSLKHTVRSVQPAILQQNIQTG